LQTSKGIYDKLVDLFSENMVRKITSLRSDLYKLGASKDEEISTCLTKAFQIRDQLQDLGEMIYDKELITIVLIALIDEQGNLGSYPIQEFVVSMQDRRKQAKSKT